LTQKSVQVREAFQSAPGGPKEAIEMEEGRPSFTAMAAAIDRAAHLMLDDRPKIFEDTFALALSGCADEAALRARLDARLAARAAIAGPDLTRAAFNFARSLVAVRARYVEDELTEAIKRGVSQYVILGAGLDSFAYRRPELVNTLRVFEVDHPATQAWKRARLHELNLAIPSNLVFVPLDFKQQSLIESLGLFGYRSDTPGLFSWLGVVPYLTHDAIFYTLRAVASMARGTDIIFDYPPPAELLDGEGRQLLEITTKAVAAQGEPFLTFFEPAALAEQVRELGFAEVWDLGAEELNARYFANRYDGLRMLLGHFMAARV
jgi:methyltransferase (TIGR00027 family)